MNQTTATYTKLRSGEWGIRVRGEVRRGDKVTVVKKSGETKMETVAAVVWRGNGIPLCAVEGHSHGHSHSHGGRSSRRECAECGEFIRSANQRCWETGGTCYAG